MRVMIFLNPSWNSMELRKSSKRRASDCPLVRLPKVFSHPPAPVRIPVAPIIKRHMSFAAPAARPGLVLPPTQSLLDSTERAKEKMLEVTGDISGGRGGELGRRLEAWLCVNGSERVD
jgi:hypothetical protein